MIDPTKFEFMTQKYGNCSSWAIWAEAGEKPKGNVGDLSVFDREKNPGLFQQLNPDVIFVGLNISRGKITVPLGNFHDPRPEAMDFKIRYALSGSPFWGGYITDILKDYEQKSSGNVMSYLRIHRSFEKKNVNSFREEIADLGSQNPIIIAFGGDVHKILTRNLMREYKIYKIPHYSNYCSKEKYREEVRSVLKFD